MPFPHDDEFPDFSRKGWLLRVRYFSATRCSVRQALIGSTAVAYPETRADAGVLAVKHFSLINDDHTLAADRARDEGRARRPPHYNSLVPLSHRRTCFERLTLVQNWTAN